MRVKFLKDSEPYFEGDVVDLADDRVQYLIDNGTVEEVDRNTALYARGVAETQNGVSVQDQQRREARKEAAESGKPYVDPVEKTELEKAADGADRETFKSGPDNEPVKGTESKPGQSAKSGKGKAGKGKK